MLSKSKKESNTGIIVKIGLLVALSVIGSMVKLQGSIAFDSMAAFFAALFISPVAGAIVGLLGHLISAMSAGFPLTMPMHIIVSLQMFGIIYIFGALWKKTNPIVAIGGGIILNGPMAALLAVPISIALGLPFNGWPLFSVIFIPLLIASVLNILMAAFLYKVMMRNKVR